MRPTSGLGVAVAVALLTACTGPSNAVDGRAATSQRPPAAADPQQLARAEATRLLALVDPPPGAHRAKHAPVRSESGPPQRAATSDLVDLSTWWTVATSPGEALAYVERRGVDGLTQRGNGSSSGPDPAQNVEYVIFDRPPTAGLHDEQVLITVALDGHGGTAIRADAQVVWLPVRPPEETIPADITSLALRAHNAGRRIGSTVVVGPMARRIVRTINEMPPVVQAVHGCGFSTGYRLVVVAGPLTFRDEVACASIAVTRGGRPLPSLQANDRFVHFVASSMGLPDYPRPPRPRHSPG